MLAIVGSFCGAIAQEHYTYISDRKFFASDDLIGYDFRPYAMEIPNQTEKELSPGEYSFGISRSNLFVDGKDLKGVYSVNNINPTEYGYKLVLMNARDPTIQGHLKVILNNKAQVEALVFKRSNKEAEIIFFLAPITEKLFDKEVAYFTDKYDLLMEDQDSIWGTKIFPFLRIHKDEGGVQERLQMADSTSIEFVEKITIIEKKKKNRKRKKDEEEIREEVLTEVESETEEEEMEITEIEAEEEIVADPGAFPPIEATTSMEEALEEEQEEVVKVKIVKEYFIIVRNILTFEDGKKEDISTEIPIKNKFTLFETQSNGDPNHAPYELEISAIKGKPITMQLTKNKTISSINIEGKTYLMRGH